MKDTVMSTGELARHFGCESWQVRRLYERGLLPPAQRIGRYRYVAVADLPAIEVALTQAGYIRRQSRDSSPTAADPRSGESNCQLPVTGSDSEVAAVAGGTAN